MLSGAELTADILDEICRTAESKQAQRARKPCSSQLTIFRELAAASRDSRPGVGNVGIHIRLHPIFQIALYVIISHRMCGSVFRNPPKAVEPDVMRVRLMRVTSHFLEESMIGTPWKRLMQIFSFPLQYHKPLIKCMIVSSSKSKC